MNPDSNFQLGQYLHKEYEAQATFNSDDSEPTKVSLFKFASLLGSVLTTAFFIAQMVTG
ncbi:MAG: hypothetical protein AAGD96_06795 [Chloroflexota bacterium]